jgi:DNA-binding NtrC family response regulator
MQTALLRVLQERTFERVGGNSPIRVDVRVIAATNRDLEAAMKAGAFREDLYYRLADITIRLPPLRERLDDIPLLATYLIDQIAREHGLPIKRLAASAMRRLAEYSWPGNVRELASTLKAALLFSDGDEIIADDLGGLHGASGARFGAETGSNARGSIPPPPAAERAADEVVYDRIRTNGISLFDMRRELERGCIARALEESGGNITRAAALLGMKRPRLSQLVREYGLAKVADVGENSE